ncbi:MAG: hypothetical protein IT311_10050 [Anaerolineales bacterium]|nr:hypothetical protein [Anaerolineales bacterium]MCZ2122126.1 hypothetical protein [Anaerolineales bacterium]
MINIYGKYLPSEKTLIRITLKNLFAVFIGGLLFAVFFLVIDGVLYKFPSLTSSFLIGITIWSFIFASIPSLLGGILLSGIIYQNFKHRVATKLRSVITGLLIAGLIGLSVSIIVMITIFRPSEILRNVDLGILATLIASAIGSWGGLEVYREINSEFMNDDKVKEKN